MLVVADGSVGCAWLMAGWLGTCMVGWPPLLVGGSVGNCRWLPGRSFGTTCVYLQMVWVVGSLVGGLVRWLLGWLVGWLVKSGLACVFGSGCERGCERACGLHCSAGRGVGGRGCGRGVGFANKPFGTHRGDSPIIPTKHNHRAAKTKQHPGEQSL